jgi:polyphenol oxidase
MPLEAMRPGWPVGLGAAGAMSTRPGGVSTAPFDSLNFGRSGGDDLAAVQENRRRWAALCGAQPVYLSQVHGSKAVRLAKVDLSDPPPVHEADASFTTERGVACTVMVADCLPVLLAAPGGRGVAAAHAGWRGLADGVLEATVAALCEASACAPNELHAWLGACIGPKAFEVGNDVLQALGASPAQPGANFVFRARADGAPRWLANLPALAGERLRASGLHHITGGAGCTVSEPSRFFSFRRDGVTGRMAASVWITG